MLDILKIDFSWKDKIKKIILPKKMTSDLAYLVGVHIGDGTMNIYKRINQGRCRNPIGFGFLSKFLLFG